MEETRARCSKGNRRREAPKLVFFFISHSSRVCIGIWCAVRSLYWHSIQIRSILAWCNIIIIDEELPRAASTEWKVYLYVCIGAVIARFKSCLRWVTVRWRFGVYTDAINFKLASGSSFTVWRVFGVEPNFPAFVILGLLNLLKLSNCSLLHLRPRALL